MIKRGGYTSKGRGKYGESHFHRYFTDFEGNGYTIGYSEGQGHKHKIIKGMVTGSGAGNHAHKIGGKSDKRKIK